MVTGTLMAVLRPATAPVALSSLAPALGVTRTEEAIVTGAAIDSRHVARGDLWFALPGAQRHAMQFAAAAVAAGAVAVVTDEAGARIARQTGALTQRLPLIVVPDARAVAGPVVAQVFGHPSRAMSVVGVTGTNGKTSVTHYLRDAWTSAARDSAVMGTLGVRVGAHPDMEGVTGFTTPEADVLQMTLASLAAAGVTDVAMEVSSHALALRRVDGTQFAAVVFTNLSQDHLDFHGTMASYFEAKARLLTPEFSHNAVVCVDDDAGREVAQRASSAGLRVLTYGSTDGDWRFRVAPGQVLHIATQGETFTAPMPSPGDFTAANLTAAAAVLALSGMPLAAVAEHMRTVTPVPGRMEPISADSGEGPTVYVDYAHSPDAVARAVTAARGASGRLIVVLGAGGDRDATKRPLMGRAASAADLVVVTDDNPRSEEPASIRAMVGSGVAGCESVDIADRAEAIGFAIRSARVGDVVLILGKGAEQGQDYRGAVLPFDDRAHARTALREWSAT